MSAESKAADLAIIERSGKRDMIDNATLMVARIIRREGVNWLTERQVAAVAREARREQLEREKIELKLAQYRASRRDAA